MAPVALDERQEVAEEGEADSEHSSDVDLCGDQGGDIVESAGATGRATGMHSRREGLGVQSSTRSRPASEGQG